MGRCASVAVSFGLHQFILCHCLCAFALPCRGGGAGARPHPLCGQVSQRRTAGSVPLLLALLVSFVLPGQKHPAYHLCICCCPKG